MKTKATKEITLKTTVLRKEKLPFIISDQKFGVAFWKKLVHNENHVHTDTDIISESGEGEVMEWLGIEVTNNSKEAVGSTLQVLN